MNTTWTSGTAGTVALSGLFSSGSTITLDPAGMVSASYLGSFSREVKEIHKTRLGRKLSPPQYGDVFYAEDQLVMVLE